ncbi:hypothetical protein GGI04_004884, partial [Coemansia thaxteri]
MDHFKRNVQTQTIDLCFLDTALSFANMPYYFYYENSEGSTEFMISKHLRDSLYVTLLDFPILAGHLVMDGYGHASIVVDRANLNLPDYRESE